MPSTADGRCRRRHAAAMTTMATGRRPCLEADAIPTAWPPANLVTGCLPPLPLTFCHPPTTARHPWRLAPRFAADDCCQTPPPSVGPQGRTSGRDAMDDYSSKQTRPLFLFALSTLGAYALPPIPITVISPHTLVLVARQVGFSRV